MVRYTTQLVGVAAALALFTSDVTACGRGLSTEIPKNVTTFASLPPAVNSAGAGGFRLIETSFDKPPVWIAANDVFELIKAEVRFMDVTDTQDLGVGVQALAVSEYLTYVF